MKNEFALAFNEVLEDKQLPRDVILDAIQAAMVSAYRRAVNASNAQHVESSIDYETGQVKIYAEKEIVDTVADSRTEVTLEDAMKINSGAQIGDMVIVETTPNNFGRVAAQTARQVIQQRIREAERDQQFNYFSNQTGEIISGVIQAVNNQAITLGLDMKTEGSMPRTQTIPGEKFRVHDRIRALLLEVKQSPRGPQIILSRAHRNFLRRLLENEVPEIYHGMIEIRSIAREPGQRSKVAVAALQPGVDPVGACVGLRGVRIQAIVRELNDEKIDVIEWNSDPAVYIAKALSPARVSGVYLNEQVKGAKTATVVVPEDQLSLAIGRDGQNARLGAKLTSWRIDIKSLPEAATDALYKLQTDANYASLIPHEEEIVPQVEAILAKKSEGRPVTPEEYSVLSQFVDRIERGIIRQRQSDKRLEEERQRVAGANIPQIAFEIAIQNFEISDRLFAVMSEAGYQTVGDILLHFRTDPDSILRLNGMGPKGMKELETALQKFEEAYAPVQIPVEQPAEEMVEVQETTPEPLETELAEVSVAAEEILEPVIERVEPSEPVEITDEAKAEIIQLPSEQEVPSEQLSLTTEEPIADELTPVLVSAEPATGEILPTTEDEIQSLDELFALQPEILERSEDEDDLDESESDQRRKKKGKKKKHVEVEYDPDLDMTIVRKKHKRGGGEWEGDW
jgi:transcription termination/antitermination protein NusA